MPSPMKPSLLIVISLILLLGFRSYSQSNLTKTIIDSKTKHPIDYVFVTSYDKTLNLISNKNGQLILINNPNIKSYSFHMELQITFLVKKNIYYDSIA